jgi:hypothetical protein
MVWDKTSGAFGHDDIPETEGRDEPIELVGTHLRVNGMINLGRFGRLTDLINASSGYVRVRDAQLLRRNGDPTSVTLPELMVDQDEISFIAQRDPSLDHPGSPGYNMMFTTETPGVRKAREFIMFTPGHTVTGQVHVFGETDLAGFVDASDPRFVPVIGVTTRSLADRRIISHYKFVLINRTHMIAASELGRQSTITAADVPDL